MENHHWALVHHLPPPPGVPEACRDNTALQESVAVSRHRQTYTTQFLRSVSGRAEIGCGGNTGSALPAVTHKRGGDLRGRSLSGPRVCQEGLLPSSSLGPRAHYRCLQPTQSVWNIQPPPPLPLVLPVTTSLAEPAEATVIAAFVGEDNSRSPPLSPEDLAHVATEGERPRTTWGSGNDV